MPNLHGLQQPDAWSILANLLYWTTYSSCSSSRSPGGSVCRYRLRNCSKTKMKALAITNMNEYLDEGLEPIPEQPFKRRHK
jgi:hypothetical protein